MSLYWKTIDTYQLSFELLVAMSKSIVSFAREYKYTFWQRIINYSLDITAEIFLAKEEFNPKEKTTHINNALKSMGLLWVIRKVCWEIPNLSINVYLEQTKNIVNIAKQLRAWREYCEKTNNSN